MSDNLFFLALLPMLTNFLTWVIKADDHESLCFGPFSVRSSSAHGTLCGSIARSSGSCPFWLRVSQDLQCLSAKFLHEFVGLGVGSLLFQIPSLWLPICSLFHFTGSSVSASDMPGSPTPRAIYISCSFPQSAVLTDIFTPCPFAWFRCLLQCSARSGAVSSEPYISILVDIIEMIKEDTFYAFTVWMCLWYAFLTHYEVKKF